MTPKVAILIDGGYFLNRLRQIQPYPNNNKVDHALQCLDWLVNNHIQKLNQIYSAPSRWALLYRVFYYDALPYQENAKQPISRHNINFGATDQAKFRQNLFDGIREKRKFALRLGHVLREDWQLYTKTLKELLAHKKAVTDLTDDDFHMNFRQKGVDMRIGMDLTSLALKRQVDTIVLVGGDSDFIPVVKLARREGIEIILDPLWLNVSTNLLEHVDGKWSGLQYP